MKLPQRRFPPAGEAPLSAGFSKSLEILHDFALSFWAGLDYNTF